MNPIVAMKHVSKRFRDVQALDDVSFEIPAGSVCALLGANGAGKTTSIRTLLGLEKPDSGQCEVLGMESVKYSQEIRSRIGYVAEKPVLYDWMTVEEIGWFTAGFYPPGYFQEYYQLILKFDVARDKKISQLSKGTRSKVSLAIALAHQPELLILDEPTSGLDPLVRREFLESMVDVASQGRTVLLCSHQVSEVERVADMVVILIEGKLVCCEKLEVLKQRTRELVVAQNSDFEPVSAISGEILAHEQRGQEHLLLIRDLDESRLASLKSAGISFQLRHPNLEEILLGLLKNSRRQAVENGSTRVDYSAANS